MELTGYALVGKTGAHRLPGPEELTLQGGLPEVGIDEGHLGADLGRGESKVDRQRRLALSAAGADHRERVRGARNRRREPETRAKGTHSLEEGCVRAGATTARGNLAQNGEVVAGLDVLPRSNPLIDAVAQEPDAESKRQSRGSWRARRSG